VSCRRNPTIRRGFCTRKTYLLAGVILGLAAPIILAPSVRAEAPFPVPDTIQSTRVGGLRSDIWGLRVARHRSGLIVLGLRDGGLFYFSISFERLLPLHGPDLARMIRLRAL
jgi:hypothetical protein